MPSIDGSEQVLMAICELVKHCVQSLTSWQYYSQLVTGYTQYLKRSHIAINLLFTNQPKLVSENQIIKTDISDPFANHLKVSCRPTETTFSYITKQELFDLASR